MCFFFFVVVVVAIVFLSILLCFNELLGQTEGSILSRNFGKSGKFTLVIYRRRVFMDGSPQ